MLSYTYVDEAGNEFSEYDYGFGSLGSVDTVKALQNQLREVAMATGKTKINPQEFDGKVGAKTIAAVYQAVNTYRTQIAKHIPGISTFDSGVSFILNSASGLGLLGKAKNLFENPATAPLAWDVLIQGVSLLSKSTSEDIKKTRDKLAAWIDTNAKNISYAITAAQIISGGPVTAPSGGDSTAVGPSRGGTSPSAIALPWYAQWQNFAIAGGLLLVGLGAYMFFKPEPPKGA